MADGFLGRWSRRKQEVREGKPVADPPAPAPVAAAPTAPTAATAAAAPAAGSAAPAQTNAAVAPPPPPPSLEDAQGLTPQSDFKPFVARDVAPEVRNLAMKKLFADPHFNVMDGLDIYIGDYTQPDPMPSGMLRKMVSAHALGFFDAPAQGDGAAGVQATDAPAVSPVSPGAIAPASGQPRDDAEAQSRADVAQSGVCNAIPSVPSSEPGPAQPSVPVGVAPPASHTHDDQDAHLRLQPDDAAQPQGLGRGTA